MPLPVIDTPPLIKRRRWPWVLAFVLIAIPCVLTLAGVLTSPPRASRVPIGRIIYLEADEPSDHTTLLRGLRITLPGSADSHELLHETEPQDTDAGSRDWFIQPKASPDGRWLAYEKQVITLQEEQQSVINQLWVLQLDTPHAQPRMLLDLTAAHLKQFVGLAWTRDSKQVVFLNDARACLVNVADGKLTYRRTTNVPTAGVGSYISVTRDPSVLGDGQIAASIPDSPLEVISIDRTESATLFGPPARIGLDLYMARSASIRPRWGWSVFGGRHVTSLCFSPDGKYLGYTVSKPPFEDELFYADIATGKCYQLPIRTGHAAWDWTW